MPNELIVIEKLVKTFKNAAGVFVVLKGIDAAFYEGQFVSIVGRSGSGKSTLLNMMTGIDHPTSGSVRIGQTVLHTMNEGRMSVWRGKNMGIVFQFFQLLPMLTLLENIMLPMDFCDMYSPAEREDRAMDLLKMVGLEGLEYKYPASVAGGQQQTAAVARALANDPPILVADEPTGNLDTKTAERVLEIFEEQVARGKTVLMVTHDNSLAQRAQRRLVISDGELVSEWVSTAFPDLPHGPLLRLSKAARPLRLEAGTLFPGAGETAPDLVIVTAGALEVLSSACPGRVQPGELFSLRDARRQERGFHGLRAAGAVELLVVEQLPEDVEPAGEAGMSADALPARDDTAGGSIARNDKAGLNSRLRRRARLRPRWHKVLSDLLGSAVRSVLVVSSIAVGLFAVGMIATLHNILITDMRAGYEQMNPANAIIFASGFDDDMVERVRKVEGVAWAEGVRVFDVMVRTGPEEWTRMSLVAVDDFDERTISRVTIDSGGRPQDDRQMMIERNKMGEVQFLPGTPSGAGGVVEIKLPSGKIREIPVTSIVHDLALGSTGPGGFFLAPIQGYIEMDAVEWLEQPRFYNRLEVTALPEEPGRGRAALEDDAYLREIANRVSEAVEDEGGLVYNAQVRGSRDHPNAPYVDAMTAVLFLLGALVMFLSTFLITNTLSALLNQQAQQIAIMKTVGARSYQIVSIYMTLILVFSLLALLFSIPLSRQAAFRLLEFLSAPLNFVVLEYRSVPLSVVLQVAIALVVPQAAGIAPILQGARVKVQDVLSGSLREDAPHQRPARGEARSGPARANRWRRRLASRPLLISLRNTFRHRGRLALTLITLTLGGAVFIGTFNVRVALENYISRVGRYFNADVNLTMDRDYRISAINEELRALPEVERAEGWAYGSSELLLADDQTGDAVNLMGPPADSVLVEPILIKGRWIRPGDTNQIVLSERFLTQYPDLDVGDSLRLRVNGEESEWEIVGYFQLVGKSAGFVAYTNYDYLSREIGQSNRAITFRIIARRPPGRELTQAEQEALGARIEALLQERGFGVTEVSAGRSLIENTSKPLNTLTTFLLIMAVLIAIVGSIGLTGMMSMNVLDRTREIGVMRAIGASDRAVMNLVIVEGVLIGMISWALGTLLAVPISKLLSDTIHMAIFQVQSEFTFTATGPLYWLGLVIALSIFASVLPARSAARLTIREALAYE